MASSFLWPTNVRRECAINPASVLAPSAVIHTSMRISTSGRQGMSKSVLRPALQGYGPLTW